MISSFLNHKYFLVLVVLACSYTQITQSDRYFGWTNSENTVADHSLTIDSDGSGYYAYLPQWFIYTNSSNFSFIHPVCEKYKTGKFSLGFIVVDNKVTSKCFIGTAICISPFFLINHTLNRLKGTNTDGYSKSYQFTVSISALFYSLLGVLGLIQLFKLFNFSNSIISLMVILTSVGTSVNFYASINPSFSHIYSFCAITWFLFFCKKMGNIKKRKYFNLAWTFIRNDFFNSSD